MTASYPKAPVLLLIFHRPDLTRQVLDAIRKYEPERLYLVADGPRESHSEDQVLCQAARQAALDIDWECEVKTMFREKNLGCAKSVNDGINWFFENEERGIILEDDTVPNPSFFEFCSELLETYERDPRVGMITGHRKTDRDSVTKTSYVFSPLGSVWGWATWRRAWRVMDFKMSWIGDMDTLSALGTFLSNKKELHYWNLAVDRMQTGRADSWAYRWRMSLRMSELVTASPAVNLVSNLGFGPYGTHTDEIRPPRDHENMDWPLTHPKSVHTTRREKRRDYRNLPDRRPVTVKALRLWRWARDNVVNRVYLIASKLLR